MLQITEKIPARIADRLLRSARTRLYWRNGGWTASSRAAQVFADTSAAIRACIENGLREVELVLRTRQTHVEVFSAQIR